MLVATFLLGLGFEICGVLGAGRKAFNPKFKAPHCRVYPFTGEGTHPSRPFEGLGFRVLGFRVSGFRVFGVSDSRVLGF